MNAFSVVDIRRVLCCALISALGIGLLAPAAQAAVKLRWKFQPGKKVNYTMKMDMTQVMEIGDMPVGSKVSQRMDMTWEVKEVSEDGTAVMEQTIDRVRMEIVPAMVDPVPIKYDSQSKEQEPGAEMLAPIFSAMVGQPFALTVTPLGEIKEVKLPPEMMAAMKEANPAVGAMFTEDSMKEMMSRSMISFPPEVEPGQKWNAEMEMANPLLGKQIVTTNYQYVGPEDRNGHKVEKVDVDVEMRFDANPDSQGTVTLSDQSGKGVIYFDNEQGLPLETEVKSEMTMEIKVGDRSLESTVTTHVTLKQVPAAKE